MGSTERTYPLRTPKDHVPPIPRWQLVLAEHDYVHTAYIGVQQHIETDAADTARIQALDAVRKWLGQRTDDGPLASEVFALLDGNDCKNVTIWTCYWLDEKKYKAALDRLSLESVYSSLPEDGRGSVGVWLEGFSTPKKRLETNYSGLDYLPGLARLPETSVEEHSRSAYWGAARDRIPASAHDLFERAEDAKPPASVPSGLGQHLVGTNFNNMVHIRSGQFWMNCSAVESASYEEKLEPTLRTGLQYLWDNPVESGAMGVRYLVNQDMEFDQADHSRKESCAAGFFSDLGSLERWAKTHRSHTAIYRGALAHAKAFGQDRKFRTWHEVSVLRRGDATFEYINCLPETGVIRFLSLTEKGV
ncbi:heme-containing dehydratase protein [Mariannaea sp. PMI_226]|nr:heme-containing dehydratase protein [Mariannaea sp. PMI_226]